MASRCEPAFERYVWDGDQMLWELRHGDSGNQNIKEPGGGPQSGSIGYVHGGDIDAPLAMIRSGEAVMLHQTWRGTYAFGTDMDGDFTTCTPLPSGFCNAVAWPGGNGSTFMNVRPKDTPYWYGLLVMDQADATGLSYRRNRYYDPVSGQFTQQDPIGIAGGLNLYGYANGDPINFSDPFGLMVEDDEVGDDPCEPFIDDEDKYAECEKGAKPLKTIGRAIGETEAAQKAFGCVGGHYGSGSPLGPVRTASYVGAIPVDKAAAGMPVLSRASQTRTVASVAGNRGLGGLKMNDLGLPRVLGANRVGAVLGRANIALSVGITAYDVFSIGMCVAGGGE
jgi:RHS repeat-associated protein